MSVVIKTQLVESSIENPKILNCYSGTLTQIMPGYEHSSVHVNNIMNSKYYYIITGKNWQKGFTSTKHIWTRFGKYFHNNIPTQINIQSWSHPLNHIRFHNNSMVWIPYNVNPCRGAFSILNWCDIMRMEYPLLTHRWNLA